MLVVEAALSTQPGVEVAQPRGLVLGERPTPGAPGELQRVLHVARLRVAEACAHRIVLVLQVAHELPGLGRQPVDRFAVELGDRLDLEAEPELPGHELEVRVVVIECREKVGHA